MARRFFTVISLFLFSAVAVGAYFWRPTALLFLVLVPIFLVGVRDMLQRKQAIRRNFPVVGNLRYLFESIRPELQQYFVESNVDGRPFSREQRSIVYQRAKGQTQTLPFGTQADVYEVGHEWVAHSLAPKEVNPESLRIAIGQSHADKPYLASVFNISAMSYGALSKTAVMALNQGAQRGGFYQNTGEGGISPYHSKFGGDLVWQIGTGYFGCRTANGGFDPELFKESATSEAVKMVEVKLSQGAKPGHGGILPGDKVTREIAAIRGVPVGQTIYSPPNHREFSTPIQLLEFVQRLRELSGGKPVGVKMCLGRVNEFVAICKAMIETRILPDFITVDGAEGGTGAAPLEFANWVGFPLEQGLAIVHDLLIGFDLRKDITLLASGKVVTAFDVLTRMALGADGVNSSRAMMLALGCIQALRCNTNNCPAGVATTDPSLSRGLHVPSKADRVYRYHRDTVGTLAELVGALGYHHPAQVSRKDIIRRVSESEIRRYDEIFPGIERGSLLSNHEKVESIFPAEHLRAKSSSF